MLRRSAILITFLFSTAGHADPLSNLIASATQNATAKTDDKEKIVMTKVEFADGSSDKIFAASVRQLKPEALAQVFNTQRYQIDASAQYFTLLFNPAYLGAGLGKDGVVRVLKQKGGELFWINNKDGSETKIVDAKTDGVNHRWLTCACNMTPKELMENWQAKPSYASYLQGQLNETHYVPLPKHNDALEDGKKIGASRAGARS